MRSSIITLICFALFAGADPVSALIQNLPLNSCINSESMSNWLNSYTSLMDLHYKTFYSNSMATGQLASTAGNDITSTTTDNRDVVHTSGTEKIGGVHTSGVKSSEVTHTSRTKNNEGTYTSGIEANEAKQTPDIESHGGNSATETEKTGNNPTSGTENNKELRTSGTENNGVTHTSGSPMGSSGPSDITSMTPGTLSGKSSREAPFILGILLAGFSALFM